LIWHRTLISYRILLVIWLIAQMVIHRHLP
jgi:hypothetical protein